VGGRSRDQRSASTRSAARSSGPAARAQRPDDKPVELHERRLHHWAKAARPLGQEHERGTAVARIGAPLDEAVALEVPWGVRFLDVGGLVMSRAGFDGGRDCTGRPRRLNDR
jgi:hypothetical protein